MPVMRYRRRSSVKLNGTAIGSIKPGNYGISPRNISFAPNVTPITYTTPSEDDDLTNTLDDDSSPPSPSMAPKLFPPSETPAPPPARKRCPPGKRRSQGYIPRPPNAFMLFRADFVRQKHVPGSIETNHGSLSKIIGNCWRQLPLEEKRIWEVKARHEKAAHKLAYPDYRFRPVHNKNKDKKKDKAATTIEDERRCEEVAQLLLEGKKGEELAQAVRNLDRGRESSATPASEEEQQHKLMMPQPQYLPSPTNAMYHRRSSSVPLPNDFFFGGNSGFASGSAGIAIPSIPFMSVSRPASPVGTISRQAQMQRNFLGHRRASSAQPALRRSWTLPASWGMDYGMDMVGLDMAYDLTNQKDDSPLPEVDSSLFSNFSFGGNSNGLSTSTDKHTRNTSFSNHQNFNVGDLINHLPQESVSPHDASSIAHSSTNDHLVGNLQLDVSVDPLSWGYDSSVGSALSSGNTTASSAYSASPVQSDAGLPDHHHQIQHHAQHVPYNYVDLAVHKLGPTEATPTATVFGDIAMGMNMAGMDMHWAQSQHHQMPVDSGVYDNAGLGLDFGLGGMSTEAAFGFTHDSAYAV